MRALLIKLVLRLVALLPLSVNHALGAMIGRLLGGETRRIARINIEKCFPDMTAQQHKQLLRQTLIESGKTLTEFGALWFKNRTAISRMTKATSGEQALLEALSLGKGVILAAPHLGSWEAVGLYCSDHHPMTSLYRPPKIIALDDMIRNARQRFGAKLVPTNAKGVRALYQALANNELVAILPDQDPREQGGHFAPFFGIETNTMTLLSRLAHKTGARVFCCYAERLTNSRGFIIHFEAAPEAIYSDDIDTSIRTLNQMIEHCVRRHPAQYQWGYKRFQTRPPGEKAFYDES